MLVLVGGLINRSGPNGRSFESRGSRRPAHADAAAWRGRLSGHGVLAIGYDEPRFERSSTMLPSVGGWTVPLANMD
jgi:hypothetical protein